MNRIITAAALGCVLTSAAQTPVYKQSDAPVEARVADLLSRMTIEEKAGQLLCPMGWEMYVKSPDGSVGVSDEFRRQNSAGMPRGSYWAVLRADPWTQKTLETGLSPRQSAEALNALQKYAVDSTRLGIPILFAEELPHGHMAIGTTVFPTGLAMASTWNPQLIRSAGQTIGREAALQGASIGYGPVLDVARDPRWSRMEETLGEDPYLTGEIGTAYMLGMQTPQPEGRRVFSTLKHFAAYGVPEAGRNGDRAVIGPIQLFSELLPPFKKAVEAGAGTVMTSYNTIDGVPSTANRFLLTDVLRSKWGFDGFVYSDLFSIDGIAGHVAPDRMTAGAMALRAGTDMDLGAAAYGARSIEALEKGLITEAEIDTAVARILRLKFRAGIFDNPFVDPDNAAAGVRTDSARMLAREVARQGITLLKNNGLLPLSKSLGRIAVIGPNADTQYNQLGDYTAPQDSAYITTILEGIRAAVSPTTEVVYVKGCAIRDTTLSNIAAAVGAARGADAVVLAVGGSSARDFKTKYIATGAATVDNSSPALLDMDCGEGYDRATLALLGDQNRLMAELLATGTPVAVVYIQGRPLDMNLAAEKADALLTAWYPGAEGGHAVADILFGDVNPSGRLPVTIPRAEGQIPVYYSKGAPRDYMDLSGKSLFPFGYGLSYTTFDYSDLSVSGPGTDGNITVCCTITNTGSRPGAEVAQLYLRDRIASVSQPPILLKGFKRLMLNPGQSEQVCFTLTPDELAIYNAALERVVEPGVFDVMVGASSADIRLRSSFTLK